MDPRDFNNQLQQRMISNIINSNVGNSENKWNLQQKSSLIESLLMSFPIGCFYVHHIGGNTVVLDGNERLCAILEFINGDFALSDLSIPALRSYQTLAELCSIQYNKKDYL
jgi:hypothetical protein